MTTGQALSYNIYESLKEITNEEKAIKALNYIQKIIVENPKKVEKIFSGDFLNGLNTDQKMSQGEVMNFVIKLVSL